MHKSLDDKNYTSNFSSEYGNTKGPFEPCEYGRFWRKVLDIDSNSERIGSNINWGYINKTLIKNVLGISMAERQGFEPWQRLHVDRLAICSITTLAPLLLGSANVIVTN